MIGSTNTIDAMEGLGRLGRPAPALLVPEAAGRGGFEARPLRVALYSHDTVGLGHTRRNLLIAGALRQAPLGANTLMLAGTGQANLLARPKGLNCVTLPALKKRGGRYESRFLDVSLAELIQIRARVIRTAIEAFEPDVFIVDKVPRGVQGELDPTLEHLRKRGNAACVLGLRDILDEPDVSAREWRRAESDEAVRNYYDAVWVYGDRSVLDVADEYGFADATAEKIRYTGYLDRRVGAPQDSDSDDGLLRELGVPDRFVLCSLGGGEDGAPLADAFSRIRFASDLHGVLLAGPFLPSGMRRELRRRAADNPRLHVIDFLSQPTELLRRAERVISMGGYNTVCENLAYEKRSLVVPRVYPRREQLIRAERFSALGLLDVCHPGDLSPQVLTDWLLRDVAKPNRDAVDLCGLDRLPELVRSLPPLRGRRFAARSILAA